MRLYTSMKQKHLNNKDQRTKAIEQGCYYRRTHFITTEEHKFMQCQ